MTEREWLNSDRVLTPLMNWLRRRGTNRKFFLAAVGWVRQVEDHLTIDRCRDLLPMMESFIDGTLDADQVSREGHVAYALAHVRIRELKQENLTSNAAFKRVAADIAAVHAASPSNAWVAAINALKDSGAIGKRAEVGPRQMALLRDIFGNPFRPVSFDPSWRTSTVVAIANGMYESRDFGPMPLLADALQDAGCEVPEIIDHCRGPGPHVRGCWVVDGVLGK